MIFKFKLPKNVRIEYGAQRLAMVTSGFKHWAVQSEGVEG
jgi:hypothetical protein